MPFTFKLSKRLALLKASHAAATAAGLAACEPIPATGPQVSTSPVVQVVTVPAGMRRAERSRAAVFTPRIPSPATIK